MGLIQLVLVVLFTAAATCSATAAEPLTTLSKVMTAKGRVDHIEETDHARGEYHLDFKLCNPGC